MYIQTLGLHGLRVPSSTKLLSLPRAWTFLQLLCIIISKVSHPLPAVLTGGQAFYTKPEGQLNIKDLRSWYDEKPWHTRDVSLTQAVNSSHAIASACKRLNPKILTLY
jgi:hypothetical protein